MIIQLSPVDYYFYRRQLYTIQFVFEYRGRLDLERFKDSLLLVEKAFPVIGSQLKIVSEKEIVFTTGHHIPVSENQCETEPSFQSSEDISRFLDSVENIENSSLIRVCATQTPSRSLVGFSFSHMLGDGSSFFQFLQMLSDIFNSKHIDRKPFQSRDLLKVVGARSQKSEKMHLFESTGYVIPRPSNPPGTQIETLKYSLRELKNLKQELLSEGTEVSTNDILMADIAKRFHRDIPLYEDRFIVRCPVDYRNILNLPPDYFGNAIRDAVAVFEKNEIEALSLGETALKIRQAIRSIDITSIRQSLECLNGLRKEAGIGIFENMGCPGLLVSNLSKFPIASIDFGLGSPIGFHHASLNPRLALILSSDDGLEVRFKRPLEVG